MKLMVDARYTRIGFHDGISRYTASLLGALKTLIDTGDEAATDLDLTMIISDERQLDMLPDLPHAFAEAGLGDAVLLPMENATKRLF